ncbi:hypothetical protein Lser_V15G04737 [Lactuca serriola]
MHTIFEENDVICAEVCDFMRDGCNAYVFRLDINDDVIV